MKTIIQFCLNRPFVAIAILCCIVVFSVLNIKRLNIDTSERSLILQDDPDLVYYDDTINRFVSDNFELIYIKDDALFTYDTLKKVEALVYELSNIEGIIKSESLFNVTNFKSVDDFLNLDPFIDIIPEDQAEIDVIKNDAIANSIIASNLISKDGKKIIIKLLFDDVQSKKDKLFDIRMVNEIETIIQKYAGDFDDIFQTGNPCIKKTLYDTIRRDRNTLLPLSVLVLLIMLIITLRSFHAAILPLLTSSISVLATMSFMTLLNIPLNLLTFIIPSLIIVIGSTEDIHILSEFFEGIVEKEDRYKAVIYLSKKVGTAILITSVTTFLGFLSISINKIVVLRQFGLAAAFGLVANPLVTLLLSPVYLRFFGPKKEASKLNVFNGMIDRVAAFIVGIILHHKKKVLIIFTIITLIFGAFIFRVRLEYDLIKNFEEKSDIYQNIETYQQHLSGFNTLFLRIKGNSDAFINPYNLKTIDTIKSALEALPEVDKALGITDYIKVINKGMNFDADEEYKIPDNEQLISQFFFLMDPVEVQKFISNDYDEVNIIIKHSLSSSDDLDVLLDKINNGILADIELPGSYRLTSFQLLTKKASVSIAMGTVQGIILLTVIIFVIMCLLFLNIKAGLISLISNTLPVIFTFGLMGMLKIPLNAGTCMVAVIALGLAVDDTVHLMSKYKHDIQELQDIPGGISASIRSELVPVFSTSMSLALLFFVLCISNLTNIKYFGFLSGMVIIYAFFCDIFLTSTLLSTTQLITLLDVLTLKVKDEILHSKLLQGLELSQVKELLLMGGLREAKRGDYIIRENEIGDNIAIILEGYVDVIARNKLQNRRVHLARLREGDIIGEIALVAPVKRTADVIAGSHLKYFVIDDKGLKRIEKIKPKITSRIYNNISCNLGEKLIELKKKYVEIAD